jgi:hypothetical protein
LLVRAKSRHRLALLLTAFLVWPANVPVVTPEAARSSVDAPLIVGRPSGAGFRRADRQTHFDEFDWSAIADNLEGTDGRADSRYAPLAIPHQPLDLPSLIPASHDSRPIGLARPPASTSHPTPLRC